MSSGEWIHLVKFLPFLPRETTFMTSCLFYRTPYPFWKWVYPFLEGAKNNSDSCLPEKNNYISVSVLLNPCPAE